MCINITRSNVFYVQDDLILCLGPFFGQWEVPDLLAGLTSGLFCVGLVAGSFALAHHYKLWHLADRFKSLYDMIDRMDEIYLGISSLDSLFQWKWLEDLFRFFKKHCWSADLLQPSGYVVLCNVVDLVRLLKYPGFNTVTVLFTSYPSHFSEAVLVNCI